MVLFCAFWEVALADGSFLCFLGSRAAIMLCLLREQGKAFTSYSKVLSLTAVSQRLKAVHSFGKVGFPEAFGSRLLLLTEIVGNTGGYGLLSFFGKLLASGREACYKGAAIEGMNANL